jgi:hypothetical protein
LLQHAIPLARSNLAATGIANADRWLDIIEARVESKSTGSNWILRHWKKYGDSGRLVCDYIDQAQTNQPVHLWQSPDA